MVINNTYQLAPWADYLYACDGEWWQEHYHDVKEVFKGELWTQDLWAFETLGINRIRSIKADSFSRNPLVIHQGSNSGYQAINLCLHWGAKKIILIGFDMSYKGKRKHWHGDHEKLKNPAPATLNMFKAAFDTVKDDDLQGCDVVNCTPDTHLKRFRRRSLEEEIRKLQD